MAGELTWGELYGRKSNEQLDAEARSQADAYFQEQASPLTLEEIMGPPKPLPRRLAPMPAPQVAAPSPELPEPPPPPLPPDEDEDVTGELTSMFGPTGPQAQLPPEYSPAFKAAAKARNAKIAELRDAWRAAKEARVTPQPIEPPTVDPATGMTLEGPDIGSFGQQLAPEPAPEIVAAESSAAANAALENELVNAEAAARGMDPAGLTGNQRRMFLAGARTKLRRAGLMQPGTEPEFPGLTAVGQPPVGIAGQQIRQGAPAPPMGEDVDPLLKYTTEDEIAQMPRSEAEGFRTRLGMEGPAPVERRVMTPFEDVTYGLAGGATGITPEAIGNLRGMVGGQPLEISDPGMEARQSFEVAAEMLPVGGISRLMRTSPSVFRALAMSAPRAVREGLRGGPEAGIEAFQAGALMFGPMEIGGDIARAALGPTAAKLAERISVEHPYFSAGVAYSPAVIGTSGGILLSPLLQGREYTLEDVAWALLPALEAAGVLRTTGGRLKDVVEQVKDELRRSYPFAAEGGLGSFGQMFGGLKERMAGKRPPPPEAPPPGPAQLPEAPPPPLRDITPEGPPPPPGAPEGLPPDVAAAPPPTVGREREFGGRREDTGTAGELEQLPPEERAAVLGREELRGTGPERRGVPRAEPEQGAPPPPAPAEPEAPAEPTVTYRPSASPSPSPKYGVVDVTLADGSERKGVMIPIGEMPQGEVTVPIPEAPLAVRGQALGAISKKELLGEEPPAGKGVAPPEPKPEPPAGEGVKERKPRTPAHVAAGVTERERAALTTVAGELRAAGMKDREIVQSDEWKAATGLTRNDADDFEARRIVLENISKPPPPPDAGKVGKREIQLKYKGAEVRKGGGMSHYWELGEDIPGHRKGEILPAGDPAFALYDVPEAPEYFPAHDKKGWKVTNQAGDEIMRFSDQEAAQVVADRMNKKPGAKTQTRPPPPPPVTKQESFGEPEAEATPPPAEPAKPAPAAHAYAGRKIYRGYGRTKKGGVYNPMGVGKPVFGPGKYYSFTRKGAENYGPEIEESTVTVKRPLIITDGEQWRALTKEAGWKYPNPVGGDKATMVADVARLRELIESKGYDGVIVDWGAGHGHDTGPNGENWKLLAQVFDVPQVVDFSAPGAGGRAGEITSYPTDQIRVDPHRFQFKLVHGEAGETGSLKGTEKYNPLLAGVIQVWKDPKDGHVYVVNGHNRHARAVAAGQANENVIFIEAETAIEARAFGALTNIAEGRGTAVDAAKFFRDSGLTVDDLREEGLKITERMTEDALALSKLSPTIFGAVTRGEFDERWGVAIGARLEDQGLQGKLVGLLNDALKKGRKLDTGTVQELADMVAGAPKSTETITDLFGTSDVTRSYAIEKANILSEIRKKLAREKRLLTTVSKTDAAKILSKAGNIIDPETSALAGDQAAAALFVFDKRKNRVGPISDAINEAAREVGEGANLKATTERIYPGLLRALSEALTGGGKEGRVTGGEPPEEGPPPAQGAGGRGLFEGKGGPGKEPKAGGGSVKPGGGGGGEKLTPVGGGGRMGMGMGLTETAYPGRSVYPKPTTGTRVAAGGPGGGGAPPPKKPPKKYAPKAKDFKEADKNLKDVIQRIGRVADAERGKEPPRPPREPFEFGREDLEKEWKASHGLTPEGRFARAREHAQTIFNKLTRQFQTLPNGPQWEPLRFALTTYLKRWPVYDRLARQMEEYIVGPLDRVGLDAFDRKVLFESLKESVAIHEKAVKESLKSGVPISESERAPFATPFGLTSKEIDKELARLNAWIAKNGRDDVVKALQRRRDVWPALQDALYWAHKENGHDIGPKLLRDEYARHQVLDKAAANYSAANIGAGGLKGAERASYLKRRQGTTKALNTDYLQAEFEVMRAILADIQKERLIGLVDKNYNIIDFLKKQATQMNHAEIMRVLEGMAPPDLFGPEGLSPRAFAEKVMRGLGQKMAMAFDAFKKAALEGELPDNGEWTDVIEALAEAEDKGTELPENIYPRLFKYAAWVMKAPGAEGKMAAATLFRGVAEKRRYIERNLEKARGQGISRQGFVRWNDLIPDSHQELAMRAAMRTFTAYTVPEQISRALLENLKESLQLTAKDLRRIRAIGAAEEPFVVPNEVAATLNELGRTTQDNQIGEIIARANAHMKEWFLLSFRRVIKSNIRNLSGDADVLFVGNPHAFLLAPRAAMEMWNLVVRNQMPTGDAFEYFIRGGLQGTLQATELPDVPMAREFEKFLPPKALSRKAVEMPLTVWKKYWSTVRTLTDYRESVLRFAAYLDYLEQMRKSETGEPNNWGASYPPSVMALTNIHDRAYKLSNELMGAYDSVTHFDRWTARQLIPFWRFQAINLRRYPALARNAAYDRALGARLGRKAVFTAARAPLIAMRLGWRIFNMAAFMAMVMAINLLWFRDEEEDLPPEVRERMHVILGRGKNGDVIAFTRLGAAQDFLEWFGADTPWKTVQDIMGGRSKEAMMDMAWAPVNKLVAGFHPFYKMVAEVPAKKTFYPDVRRPGRIRGTGLYMARQLALEPEYKKMVGLPTRQDYLDSLQDAVIYRYNPQESAYYETLDNVYRFKKEVLGRVDDLGGMLDAKSNALYWWRYAVKVGDRRAEEQFRAEYYTAGGTDDGLEKSFRSLHPLSGLQQGKVIKGIYIPGDADIFVDSMTPHEKRQYEKAVSYFESLGGIAAEEPEEEEEETSP